MWRDVVETDGRVVQFDRKDEAGSLRSQISLALARANGVDARVSARRRLERCRKMRFVSAIPICRSRGLR